MPRGSKDARKKPKLLRFIKSREFKSDLALASATPNLSAATTEIWALLEILRTEQAIPAQYKAHKLNGVWADWWDCHLAGNFVLIWRYEARDGERVVVLARVGTHQYLDIG